MKTPEEIKRALKGCTMEECPTNCPYYDDGYKCAHNKSKDALAYIEQLEAENDQLKKSPAATISTVVENIMRLHADVHYWRGQTEAMQWCLRNCCVEEVDDCE